MNLTLQPIKPQDTALAPYTTPSVPEDFELPTDTGRPTLRDWKKRIVSASQKCEPVFLIASTRSS